MQSTRVYTLIKLFCGLFFYHFRYLGTLPRESGNTFPAIVGLRKRIPRSNTGPVLFIYPTTKPTIGNFRAKSSSVVCCGNKCRGEDKRSIVNRDKKDPQPYECDIHRSPAGSSIGLYGACFGRLNLKDASKKAHLAGYNCDNSWPEFINRNGVRMYSIQFMQTAVPGRKYWCTRKQHRFTTIGVKYKEMGKGLCKLKTGREGINWGNIA